MNTQNQYNWQLHGYEDMEVSTQMIIKEALRRKIKVEILDREDNFILLSKGRKKEFIKQATFTSGDNLINYFIMLNKDVTKQILKARGLNVPEGKTYSSFEKALDDYENFKSETCIVKPLRVDAGAGISVVLRNSKSKFKNALKKAYLFDSTVLVEKFITGDMYRFLIINGKISAVMKGVPANVIGNSKHTVLELIKIKNSDPRRISGLKESLLYPIQTGKIELEILKEQNLNLKSVPEKGETVFLRRIAKNSLGGDTFDMTDIISTAYKNIAINAVKTLEVKICGVDMIIKDYSLKPNNQNYAILELNFNPSLRVHKFPFEGKPRNVENDVLDFLGF